MSTRADELRPPRWAIERGVPEDARTVRGRLGARWVKGREAWGIDPNGRLVHTIWHEPTPEPEPAPRAVSVDDAIRSLAGPAPINESYEQFGQRMQALGLAVQLGLIAAPRPKPPVEPTQPGTNVPEFEQWVTALAEHANSDEAARAREVSVRVADECEREIRAALTRRVAEDGSLATRAANELHEMEQRAMRRERR